MNVPRAHFLPRNRLETPRLVMEPLTEANAPSLVAATSPEPDLFRYLHLDIRQAGALDLWVTNALTRMTEGSSLHFVLSLQETMAVIGHTAVVGIRPVDRKCEIAWTWLVGAYQRRNLALESKASLYSFLFGAGMKRVQLLADERNLRSLRSIERSGARREGILRCNRLTQDGTWQNTVVMSILDEEWAVLSSPPSP